MFWWRQYGDVLDALVIGLTGAVNGMAWPSLCGAV
jgi:hypothetical protein